MPLSFSLDTVGPLARTVEDVALAMQALAGPHPDDPTAAAHTVPDYAAALTRSVKGLRIGVPNSYFFDEIDPAIGALVTASVDVLRSLGCTIVRVDIPDLEAWNNAATTIIASEAGALHSAWLRERPGDYSEQVRARLELGLGIPAAQYINSLRLRGEALSAWLRDVMADIDALHVPAVAFRTPTIAETDVGGGARMGAVLAMSTRLMRLANFLGTPSLAVPCGFQPHGLPCAFQLYGRPFEESTLLAVGHAYQSATDYHARRAAV